MIIFYYNLYFHYIFFINKINNMKHKYIVRNYDVENLWNHTPVVVDNLDDIINLYFVKNITLQRHIIINVDKQPSKELIKDIMLGLPSKLHTELIIGQIWRAFVNKN